MIIDAIHYIREKKQRPSAEAIYEKVNGDNADLDDDIFIEEFKNLEKRHIIVNNKPKDDYGSYNVCYNKLIDGYQIQFELLKNEKINNDKIIQILQDQLEYMKTEIKEKNLVIERILLKENKVNIETEKSEIIKCSTVEKKAKLDNSLLETFESKEQEREIIQNNLYDQLTKVRIEKHQKYMKEKHPSQPINNVNDKDPEQAQEEKEELKINKGQWKDNMVLIAGDSTLCGLMEKRMGNNIRVRSFPGARIKDMYYYLTPLIAKRPTYIILHVSTNDAADKSSADEILNDLLQLKQFIEKSLPDSTLIISYPLIRTDRIGPKRTIFDLREKLNMLNINCIMHENLTEEHLGKGGLHLNAKGLGRLATNYISFIRQL